MDTPASVLVNVFWSEWNNGVLAGCNPVASRQVGSIPTHSTNFICVYVSQVRHLALEVRSRWFESNHTDQFLALFVYWYYTCFVIRLRQFDSVMGHQV